MSKKRGRTLTLGVIIGFFIGLFLAPKKGTELRCQKENRHNKRKSKRCST